MPRIRTVKPEFWQDEKLAILDPLTRLVFLGLISVADDAGRLVDNLKMIDGFVFPETTDSAATALEILAKSSRICRYVSSSGQRLIQIRNWDRHQKVDHPNIYTLPGPTVKDLETQTLMESSRDPRESNATVARDPLATTNDQRPTTNDHIRKPSINGKRIPDSDEAAVIAHYRSRHPKRLRGEVPGKTVKLLRKALKSYSVAELCQAIDNNAASAFHREGNHMGLDLILRDPDHIDRFIGLKEPAKPGDPTDEPAMEYVDG